MVTAAGGKPVWMTLQIAWSGVAPTQDKPELVPRFPTLQAERFMAYQAIVAGARGLVFFGGHLTQVASPGRREARLELDVLAAGAAAARRRAHVGRRSPGARRAGREAAGQGVDGRTSSSSTRDDGTFLYVIAVRRKGTTRRRHVHRAAEGDGPDARRGAARVRAAAAAAADRRGLQVFRPVDVAGGSFRDWLAPHDARVYRFRK